MAAEACQNRRRSSRLNVAIEALLYDPVGKVCLSRFAGHNCLIIPKLSRDSFLNGKRGKVHFGNSVW